MAYSLRKALAANSREAMNWFEQTLQQAHDFELTTASMDKTVRSSSKDLPGIGAA